MQRTLAMTIGVACSAIPAFGGDLAPPAGPVAPTMKDLDDVEPRTALRNMFNTLTPVVIQFPGSYYLAEDIDALPNEHGIEILADNVTLDLNGFTVRGNTEVGSLDGIHVDSARRNTTIVNGTVESFFQSGINAQEDLTLIDVRLLNNSGAGVNASTRAVIQRCLAIGNGNRGYLLSSNATLVDCVAEDNTLNGFSLGSYCSVRGCTASENTGDGFSGGIGTVFEGCASDNNDVHGFDTNGKTAIIGCSAMINGADGFDINSEGVIAHCTAWANAESGIQAGGQNVIRYNSCVFNQAGHGIHLTSDGNLVEGNVCQGHSTMLGTGILVEDDGNRIDSNHVSENGGGIIVQGTNNFIVRNTAFANISGNYAFAVGNEAGATSNDPATAGPWDNLEN